MELTEKYFLKWLLKIVLNTRKKNKMIKHIYIFKERFEGKETWQNK